MEKGEVLLRVERLCQYFRMGNKELKAVDDISFEVKKGEVFGLVGESGCGKTTTGRSIIKLYDITSGNIYFKGQRIGAGTRLEKGKDKIFVRQAQADSLSADKRYAQNLVSALDLEYKQKIAESHGDEAVCKKIKKEYLSKRRVAKKSRLITQIQMIFQDPIASLNPRMTVRDIIAEGLIINGVRDKKYINERVYEILEMVGLVREHADRYPHEFSGGQRQRIGIARAIIMQPEMIIADEPISALDVSIQAQVINLLNDLRSRLGLTILFIAHDLSVVKYFSDRIAVMHFGKIIELAASKELFENPLHPYTRSLLSAIPLPDPCYEKQRVRLTYRPIAEHDYSVDLPSMREISAGHFVYCNNAEEERYKQQIKKRLSKAESDGGEK